MMEKLIIKSNGQWKLVKAVPTAPNVYATTYNLDHRDPTKSYTGKDLEHMQNVTIANSTQKKEMMNPNTGQKEPHVLVHFGVTNHDPDYKAEQNSLSLKDNHVHVTSPKGAVVSGKANFSSDFTDRGEQKSPKLFSFWVPKSHINGDCFHVGKESGYLKLTDKQRKKYNDKSSEHVAEKLWDEDDDPHEAMSQSASVHDIGTMTSHEDEGHFISIRPGKYHPALPEDIEESIRHRERRESNLGSGGISKEALTKWRDRVKFLHRNTFPHLYANKG